MQLSPETTRAAEVLRGIFQRGKILKLSEPKRLSGGNSYALVVTAYGKETDFCLSREQLDDTPGTPGYREAADSLARVLEFRFKNIDPNLFVSASGRLLHISPEWPPFPLLNSDRTAYISANGTRVLVKDALSEEIAICLLKMTLNQTYPGPHNTPFHRLPAIVNSIRADVDAGKIVFHPSLEQHPKTIQNVDFRLGAKTPEAVTLSRYIEQKVWLLGFRAGRKDTQVWISDPWDASYVGSTPSRMRQEAAILDARDILRLDENEDFASAGKGLLARAGTTPSALKLSPSPPTSTVTERKLDVFVSHSTVDKPYVEPLVKALVAAGISVWFDESEMEWGDSLLSEIDRGLAACRYGIVVFSKAFLDKRKWTQHEFNALFAKEELGKKVILPIWHGVTREELIAYSPSFADRLAKNPETHSHDDIVQSLLAMLGRPAIQAEAVKARSKVTSPSQMPDPPGPKPNAIVHARYDAKGKSASWVRAYIRGVPNMPGQFTFENSEGELKQGDQEQVALEFLRYDRTLKAKGYTRMEFGNLSGNRAFDL